LELTNYPVHEVKGSTSCCFSVKLRLPLLPSSSCSIHHGGGFFTFTATAFLTSISSNNKSRDRDRDRRCPKSFLNYPFTLPFLNNNLKLKYKKFPIEFQFPQERTTQPKQAISLPPSLPLSLFLFSSVFQFFLTKQNISVQFLIVDLTEASPFSWFFPHFGHIIILYWVPGNFVSCLISIRINFFCPLMW